MIVIMQPSLDIEILARQCSDEFVEGQGLGMHLKKRELFQRAEDGENFTSTAFSSISVVAFNQN